MKLRFLIPPLLILTACAKPNYQTVGTDSRGIVRFSRIGWSGDWQWERMPTDRETGSFLIRFWQGEVKPPAYTDPGFDLSVYLWMPSMGHGSSPITVTRVQNGVYRADQVFFIMHGDWELHVQLKRNGAVADEAVYPLRY